MNLVCSTIAKGLDVTEGFAPTKTHDVLQASFCRYLHLCVDPIEYDDRSTQHLSQSHADHMAAVPIHRLMADHWIF